MSGCRSTGRRKAGGPKALHPSWVLDAALAGRLEELPRNLPSLDELGVSQGMMEAAAEIAAGADGQCIEHWRLSILVRALVHLADQRQSPRTCPQPLLPDAHNNSVYQVALPTYHPVGAPANLP